jgi:hypothetical protein
MKDNLNIILGIKESNANLESGEDDLLNELIGFSHQSSTPPPSVPLIHGKTFT